MGLYVSDSMPYNGMFWLPNQADNVHTGAGGAVAPEAGYTGPATRPFPDMRGGPDGETQREEKR